MTADAIVIGAGIVGAAVADALTADGLSVLVVEQSFPGSGATGAGMGHVVVMDDATALLELSLYSRRLLDELVPTLPPSCEFERCGTIWIAEDEDELRVVNDRASRCAQLGLAAQVLDPHMLAEAEPQLRPGLAGALRVPDDSVVYPPSLCAFLIERAVTRGARLLRDTEAVEIGPHRVSTSRGNIEAALVVNAAGAAAPALTPGLGVVPRKGHLVVTDRYPGFCRHQLVELGYTRSAHELTAQSSAFNVQPRRTGQLLIGSTRELVGFDRSINRALVGRMLERAAFFLPRLRELLAVRTWTGFRPASEDGLPLIGRWDAVPGLWIASGHEGLGITLALGTARVLADLIGGRAPACDARRFAPMRSFAAADG